MSWFDCMGVLVFGIANASKLAADANGFSPETVRRWASGCFTSIQEYGNTADDVTYDIEQVLFSNRGHTASPCATLILDEEFQMNARKFLHKNAYNTGQPNLTSLHFSEWVKLHYNVSIHEETVKCWLHLGFNHNNHFISMDTNANVQSRQEFVHTLMDLIL